MRRESLSKSGPYLLYLILAFLLYGPHFIYLEGLPQILSDSFAYFIIAADLIEGNLPLEGYYLDLPLGYPLFISSIYNLGGNLQTVIGIQTLIFLTSFLLLIDYFNKKSTVLGYLCAILCFGFISTSESLLWCTLLYTEGLFIASIVCFSYFLLKFLSDSQPKYVLSMIAAILMAALMRSNGIYLFGIIGVLMLVQKNLRIRLFIILGVGLCFITSSLINKVIKDTAFPFESNRIAVQVLGFPDTRNKFKITQSKLIKNNSSEENLTISSQAVKLFLNPSKSDFGNHYYYRMQRQMHRFLLGDRERSIKEKNSIARYKDVSESDYINVLNLIEKDIDYSEKEIKEFLDITNIEKRPRNAWLYLCHLLHLGSFFFRNILFLLIFWVVTLYSYFKSVRIRFRIDSIYTKVSILSFVYIFSTLLMVYMMPRDTSLSRYSIVTEIIILILPLYFVSLRGEWKNRREEII